MGRIMKGVFILLTLLVLFVIAVFKTAHSYSITETIEYTPRNRYPVIVDCDNPTPLWDRVIYKCKENRDVR